MTNPAPECDHRSTEKGWRDIGSAPKDGTRIDIWFRLSADHGARWMGCWWSYERCNWIGGPSSQYEGGWVATHWMPIPHPPAHQENSPRSVGEQRCDSDICAASRDDGIVCPDDECDRTNGVRPAPEPAPQVREVLEQIEALSRTPEMTAGLQWGRAYAIAKNALDALTPVVAREPVGWPSANRAAAEEFCKGAFGPFGVALEPYIKIVTELLDNACADMTSSPTPEGMAITATPSNLTSPPPASAVREALEIGANVTLPDTYQWSKANIQKFNFGRDRAVESIRAALSVKGV